MKSKYPIILGLLSVLIIVGIPPLITKSQILLADFPKIPIPIDLALQQTYVFVPTDSAVAIRNTAVAPDNHYLIVVTTDNGSVTPYSPAPPIPPYQIVGCDPVSGRNQQVVLRWDEFPLANEYEIWVVKDLDGKPDVSGTPIIFVTSYTPINPTSSSYIIAPGNPNLQCGHTYWWRVRARGAVTGQRIRSAWSEWKSFAIKAGLPVTTPSLNLEAMAPVNGATGVPIKPVSFSWTSYKEITEYQFQLAEDAGMTKLLVDTLVPTTAYTYDAGLNYLNNYYWRVRATKPAFSDWSSVFSFLTEPAPPPPPPTPPSPLPITPPLTPMWVWIITGIGTVLVTVNLILIIKPRRVL